MADPLKRITTPTRQVLSILLQEHPDHVYGLEIAKATGIRAGSLYPILARLEDLEWLESVWETIDPTVEKRPRRRYYILTGEGVVLAREVMANTPEPILRLLPGTIG